LLAKPFVSLPEADHARLGELDIETVLVPGLDAHRVVLVNGRFVPSLSGIGNLGAGARAGSLRDLLKTDPAAIEGKLTQIAGTGGHLFDALNTAGLDDGFVLYLPSGHAEDRPFELIHLSLGQEEPVLTQPRHFIVLGDGAQASLIERFVSLETNVYFTNNLVELQLGRHSRLVHHRVQEESASAFHQSGLYLRQAGESRYMGVNLALGGAWSRTDLHVRFAGEGALCDLQGLYLAGDGQLVDFHLDVDHQVPACSSREAFKGILYGQGRAVFDGNVQVGKHAQKTDAHLSNANLLLSRNAEVDTKPQLVIHADDVKCSHGTTVGQLDADAMFYLRARGIPLPAARRMLCLGFAEEVIEGVAPEVLRTYVSERVGRRLEDAPLSA
jgi:Fe-S cluster assembly protein SufD